MKLTRPATLLSDKQEYVPVSGSTLAHASSLFELDPLTAWQGKRVLDLGAGFSTTTAELRRGGIDAYALDIRHPSEVQFERELKLQRKKSEQGGDLVKLDTTNLLQTNLETFKRMRPWRVGAYICGGMTELPIRDASFDIAFSTFALTAYLRNERELVSAYQELVRVIRPGGSIYLEGWLTHPALADYLRANPDDPRLIGNASFSAKLLQKPRIRETVPGADTIATRIDALSCVTELSIAHHAHTSPVSDYVILSRE